MGDVCFGPAMVWVCGVDKIHGGEQLDWEGTMPGYLKQLWSGVGMPGCVLVGRSG